MVTIDELLEQHDHDNVTLTVKGAELAVDERRAGLAPSVLATLRGRQAAAFNRRPFYLDFGAVNGRCATGASLYYPLPLSASSTPSLLPVASRGRAAMAPVAAAPF
jgi:hypothetical protein